MRLIGTLEDERKAQAFSQFLSQKGIAHQIEFEKETRWESPSYGLSRCHIWINDEDHLNEVSQWFQLFLNHPDNPIFRSQAPESPAMPSKPALPLPPSSPMPQPAPPRTPSAWEKQPMGWITKTLIAVCCILFLFSQLLMPSIQVPERYAGFVLFSSPIEKTLLYDYPKFYELIDRFLRLYGYEELEHPSGLPPEGERLLLLINQTPFWPGYYQLLLKGGWQAAKTALTVYPTFEKIRDGQIWRLFTPCLLHADILHILFNMLWLVVLGKQIEQRLAPWRYVLFIAVIGVISNTVQYLASGPNFIGFSGILVGMLAFVWVRQKRAAWEGYQIDRLTLIFMLLFIMGMAGIQLLSFVLEKSFAVAFSPNIANTAHLTGGLMGFLFGRMSFFSWRHQ